MIWTRKIHILITPKYGQPHTDVGVIGHTLDYSFLLTFPTKGTAGKLHNMSDEK